MGGINALNSNENQEQAKPSDIVAAENISNTPNSDSKKVIEENKTLDKTVELTSINNYLDANMSNLTASEADMVYVDLFKTVVENGATSKSINNLNTVLLDTKLDTKTKNTILKGVIDNIKARTEKNEAFVNGVVDKKTEPEKWNKWADRVLKDLAIEGMTVGKKEMTYTIGSDGRTLLGKGRFPAKDERNGDIPGGYNPNVFKDGWINKPLTGAFNRDRYFLLNEKEETKTLYSEAAINKTIIANAADIPSDGTVTVNINKDLFPKLDVYDKNNRIGAIQNMLFVNAKIKSDKVKVNFVEASQANNGVKMDVDVPAKTEVLSAKENIILTTQFERTKSDLNEGDRKQQLINTFKDYLKQDENGKRTLDTDKYKIAKINRIEGNASSIYDPNATDAQQKNQGYAEDRLNTALAFLNDIGTPKDIIDGSSKASLIHNERQDEADQNIKIDREIQKVLEPATEAYSKSINVDMPTEKLVTWDVVHTRLSNEPKDDPNEGLIGKIFG